MKKSEIHKAKVDFWKTWLIIVLGGLFTLTVGYDRAVAIAGYKGELKTDILVIVLIVTAFFTSCKWHKNHRNLIDSLRKEG